MSESMLMHAARTLPQPFTEEQAVAYMRERFPGHYTNVRRLKDAFNALAWRGKLQVVAARTYRVPEDLT